MLEDFHSRNSEDPLEVFRSCSKTVLGIIPYMAAVILLFISMKGECQKYFRFREPRVIFYKDYTPMVWCAIEAQKILKGIIPFDYKKDTK